MHATYAMAMAMGVLVAMPMPMPMAMPMAMGMAMAIAGIAMDIGVYIDKNRRLIDSRFGLGLSLGLGVSWGRIGLGLVVNQVAFFIDCGFY